MLHECAHLFIAIGILFFIFWAVDFWLFVYHPFDVNIMIDLEDLKLIDKMRLQELIKESELQDQN